MAKAKAAAVPPLSHSSAQTLLGCEQKYQYYKIEGAAKDPDYAKSDSLAVGSAFHKILEWSKHEKPASITKDLNKCITDPDIRLPEEHVSLVHAMVLKYLRLHRRSELEAIVIEAEIKTNYMHGYVDVIYQDQKKNWWIGDLKTSKQFYESKLRELTHDPQLNLYAAHRAILAEMFGLDLKKFAGCRYRVVTKSQAKQQAKETYADFVMRLSDKHIKAYDISIPADLLDTESRLEDHHELFKRAKSLTKRKPMRNYSFCMSFFQPCEYWSKCHGGRTYTESAEILKVEMEP